MIKRLAGSRRMCRARRRRAPKRAVDRRGRRSPCAHSLARRRGALRRTPTTAAEPAHGTDQHGKGHRDCRDYMPPGSHRVVARSYSPVEESRSAKMDGSTTVAGSRLAARSAADEGSRPPVNRANNSAPPTLKSALSSPRALSNSVRSVELRLLPLRSPAWSAATNA